MEQNTPKNDTLPILELNNVSIRYITGDFKEIGIKEFLLRKITGYKERSVCEDVEQHFAYWQEAVNNNRNDCSNLKR